MKIVFAVVAALGFLAMAIALCLHEWREIGGADMSAAGYAALVIGAIVATLLGGGLMGLVFFSSRSGLDDEVAAAGATAEQSDDARH